MADFAKPLSRYHLMFPKKAPKDLVREVAKRTGRSETTVRKVIYGVFISRPISACAAEVRREMGLPELQLTSEVTRNSD